MKKKEWAMAAARILKERGYKKKMPIYDRTYTLLNAKCEVLQKFVIGGDSCESSLSCVDIQNVLAALAEACVEALYRGETVSFPNLGTFKFAPRCSTPYGRDKETGEVKFSEPCYKIKFKQAESLKPLGKRYFKVMLEQGVVDERGIPTKIRRRTDKPSNAEGDAMVEAYAADLFPEIRYNIIEGDDSDGVEVELDLSDPEVAALVADDDDSEPLVIGNEDDDDPEDGWIEIE